MCEERHVEYEVSTFRPLLFLHIISRMETCFLEETFQRSNRHQSCGEVLMHAPLDNEDESDGELENDFS